MKKIDGKHEVVLMYQDSALVLPISCRLTLHPILVLWSYFVVSCHQQQTESTKLIFNISGERLQSINQPIITAITDYHQSNAVQY